MGTALVIASLVGTAVSINENRKAQKEQRKASRATAKIASLTNARERRRVAAESIRARAATVAQAEGQGIGGSSVAVGAAGSVQTQGASNQAFLSQLEGLDRNRASAFDRASSFSSRANIAGALGSLAKSFKTN